MRWQRAGHLLIVAVVSSMMWHSTDMQRSSALLAHSQTHESSLLPCRPGSHDNLPSEWSHSARPRGVTGGDKWKHSIRAITVLMRCLMASLLLSLSLTSCYLSSDFLWIFFVPLSLINPPFFYLLASSFLLLPLWWSPIFTLCLILLSFFWLFLLYLLFPFPLIILLLSTSSSPRLLLASSVPVHLCFSLCCPVVAVQWPAAVVGQSEERQHHVSETRLSLYWQRQVSEEHAHHHLYLHSFSDGVIQLFGC